MRILPLVILFYSLAAAAWAGGPELQAPATVQAGSDFSVSTGGSGSGMLYLIGPGHVSKRTIQLGRELTVGPDETRSAGSYLLIACSAENCATRNVEVTPASADSLVFLVHPSRVPVAEPNVITAVAVVMDRFQNLVLQPSSVTFQAALKDSPAASLPVKSRLGIAWARLNSGPKEGKVEIRAAVGDAIERRVVQQVASEPCNLRASAQPSGRQLLLQTDPIRDCKGNALPDGTIVTFTKVDKVGRSTVDAPIKKGIARTEMSYGGPATVSVACGVTLGNEIRVGGGQ